MVCVPRSQFRGGFAEDDLEAAIIWRRNIEARVTRIEKDIRDLQFSRRGVRVESHGKRYLTLLREYISEDEARELAFKMNVEWSELSGDNLRGRILSLVITLEKQGRLYQLEELVRELRPNIDWPPFV